MDSVREQLRELNAFVYTDTPAASRRSFNVFLFFLAISAAVTLWTGPYVQNAFGHDLPVYYGTAWKMLWGYKPHIDFNCTHGIVNFLPVVAGMKLTGLNVYSIVTGNTLVFLIVSAVAWAACRLRFAPWLCLIYALLVGWVILCAHHLRFDLFMTSYAGLYNRHGYALLLILMAQSFLPRKAKFAHLAVFDGAIFGSILALLFFLKITYFLAGIGIFALAVLLFHFSWKMMSGVPLGSAVIALPILLYFRFNLAPYFQDLALAAAVRSGLKNDITNSGLAVISSSAGLAFIFPLIPTILVLFLMCLLVFPRPREWLTQREPWLKVVFIAAIAAISVCILLTNAPLGDTAEAPLISALGLLFWQVMTGLVPLTTSSSVWRQTAVGLLALGLIVPFSASALGSVAYSAYYKFKFAGHMPPEEVFTASPLAGLMIRGAGGDPLGAPFTYAQKINDGLELLDRNVSRSATVETLDFTNIFPFASGRPPAKGALSWQYGLSFTVEHTLPVARAFGDPDVFLIPKYSGDPMGTEMLLKIYGDYLHAHYQLGAQSPSWVLLRRAE